MHKTNQLWWSISHLSILRIRFKRHKLIWDELIYIFFRYSNFPLFYTSHQFGFNITLCQWMGPEMGPLSGKNWSKWTDLWCMSAYQYKHWAMASWNFRYLKIIPKYHSSHHSSGLPGTVFYTINIVSLISMWKESSVQKYWWCLGRKHFSLRTSTLLLTFPLALHPLNYSELFIKITNKSITLLEHKALSLDYMCRRNIYFLIRVDCGVWR